MDIPDVLRIGHVMDFLFLMKDGPRMENEFRGIRNSYYQNRDTLDALVEAGMVERVDDERQRGRMFALTEKGRKVLEGYEVVCSAAVSERVRMTDR